MLNIRGIIIFHETSNIGSNDPEGHKIVSSDRGDRSPAIGKDRSSRDGFHKKAMEKYFGDLRLR